LRTSEKNTSTTKAPSQASQLPQGRCTSAGDWSAGGPPSLAGQLPQGLVYICKRLIGWQAAIAGRPAPTGFGLHLQETGRLTGRHRWQASSHN
jgi:hypothetical protein